MTAADHLGAVRHLPVLIDGGDRWGIRAPGDTIAPMHPGGTSVIVITEDAARRLGAKGCAATMRKQ